MFNIQYLAPDPSTGTQDKLIWGLAVAMMPTAKQEKNEKQSQFQNR